MALPPPPLPPPPNKIKAQLRQRCGLEWSHTDSCYHCLRLRPDLPLRLAAYDLDDTLMSVSNSEPHHNVISHLREQYKQGFQVVIISNQYGITKGNTTHEAVQARFQNLDSLINCPGHISYMYATDKDHYRKPMTGMFDLLVEKYRSITGRPVDKIEGFYCGDAVGRAKDFAVSDLYFAQNCGIRCITPELNDASLLPAKKYNIYADLDLVKSLVSGPLPTPAKAPFLVIMVGPQGSGKSTMSKQFSSCATILNNDTIKSKSRMNKEFHRLIQLKTSIVMDNTNYSKSTRAEYILPAKANGYSVIIYYFDIPKELSFHMCHMRVQLKGVRVPPVAVHTYYKNLEPPTSEEGELHIFSGIPAAQQDIPKEYYFKYNLKDR